MDSSSFSPAPTPTRAEFEELITEIRPQLHRYVTRMIGSVIDGEDVVQEALTKAYNSLGSLTSRSNLRGWLFRIAHNKAVDFLRHHNQLSMERLDEQPLVAEPDLPLEDKEIVALALSMFLKLAPRQRSCVILKDVLGYSLAEISELLNATVPEIKAALHRGRTRLRELGGKVEVDGPAPTLDEYERERLARYIEYFNAHDFEAVQAMLTEEVQLDLISRTQKRGLAQIKNDYFANYRALDDWHFTLGVVEGRPAILVYNPHEGLAQPAYFILLSWENNKVALIRDYRYVRYVVREARISTV
jgi:RNA polymerase sigma-70 factor (ECF subfamily)